MQLFIDQVMNGIGTGAVYAGQSSFAFVAMLTLPALAGDLVIKQSKHTDAMKIIAYVICSGLAGVAGILFALNLNSVQPSGLGEFYELYAIAGAVLGGCSLRGGEGSILGVIIGSAVMRVLYNSINILRIPTHWEFAIIGAVILSGVIVDELVKRVAARRRSSRP